VSYYGLGVAVKEINKEEEEEEEEEKKNIYQYQIRRRNGNVKYKKFVYLRQSRKK